MGGMLTRLTDRRDYLRVQTEGRRSKGALVTVLFLPTPGTDGVSPARVGFTVSRKVGNAVVRNRVRRRLRELARHHASCLSSSFDYVVIAAPAAATATFARLRDELGTLLERAARTMDASRSAPAKAPDSSSA